MMSILHKTLFIAVTSQQPKMQSIDMGKLRRRMLQRWCTLWIGRRRLRYRWWMCRRSCLWSKQLRHQRNRLYPSSWLLWTPQYSRYVFINFARQGLAIQIISRTIVMFNLHRIGKPQLSSLGHARLRHWFKAKKRLVEKLLLRGTSLWCRWRRLQ